MELIERPNLRTVHFLNSISFETFKADCINDAVDSGKPKPNIKDIQTWYSTLKQFCKTNIKTKGNTKRIYSYSMNTPVGLGGRLFCGNSMQGIWGVYRGALMNGISTDIDMCNAHPVILNYVCKKHHIECPNLEYYVNHRDDCLSKFPSRSSGKNAYLVATNNDKLNTKRSLPDHFKQYDKEMKRIQATLVKEPEYSALIETIPEYKQTENYNGSAINRILCYYENIILQHALHVINSKGLEVAILMFDGCMVYGNHYEDHTLLNDIQQYVEEQMPGLNMKWAYKECDTSLSIPEDFDETDYSNDALNDYEDQKYLEWKATHESEWAKISNSALFIRSYYENGVFKRFVSLDRQKLFTAYEHVGYTHILPDGKQKKKQFIKIWLDDPNIRTYEEIGMYPPPLVCPNTVYNTWIPFPFQNQPFTGPDDPDINKEAIEAFISHIDILCNQDPNSTNWVCSWFAHLLQCPAVKPEHCISLISDEGAGKNTILNVMGDIIGRSKILETSSPERDVWGPFNSGMAGKILVILSETDKRNSFGADGKIKALITDPTIVINAKGKDAYECNSFVRGILTTNNKDPVHTSNDDRRNYILRCSDSLIGNTAYFNELHRILDTPNALRSIYWSFMQFDISNWNFRKVPRTSYHQDIIETSRNPIDMFIEHIAIIYRTEPYVELSGTELLNIFRGWRSDNNFRFGENINACNLIRKIKTECNLPEECVSKHKTKTCTRSVFNISLLTAHYGLTELPDEDELPDSEC